MTKLAQMLDEINAPDGYGVLLLAQMDSVPDTVQLMIATTAYDAEVDGLRDKSRYLVRAVGVQEHQLSVGIFQGVQHLEGEAHPLLYQYNSQPTGLFFRGGPPANPDGLLLRTLQIYTEVFGAWRHMPAYLNVSKPLMDVFSAEGDLVGEMPRPLAEALTKAFADQQLETKIIDGQKDPEQPPMKVLLLDHSYIVAMDFSVDELGKA